MSVLAATATTATAQAPRKQACELLAVADVEAVTGVSPLRASDPTKTGKNCRFEKVVDQPILSINLEYTDPPDADAVNKWLKTMETKTFNKARPAAGIGDAAYYTELQGNPSAPKTLTVFVGGRMLLQLGPGTSDQQLRTLAEKALGGGGRTAFVYNGVVPAAPRPVSPPPTNAALSPLDQLKSELTKKADAGDVRAEEALAGLYRFSDGSGLTAKSDFAAARYWYKRASDHGVARASYQLGTMYHQGIGGTVNDDAAQALFTKAADAGYVPAMLPLAFLYASKPDFVSKRRAADWAVTAAAADDPEGHLVAGYLWEKGLLSFDDAESGRSALAEYRKAADKGKCLAMLNMGNLYFNGGRGITQNGTQAEAWYGRAESCFGKDFQEMQARAARYRKLAAAGHLPVPPAPAAPRSGSRFFKPRPKSQPPHFSDGLDKFVAGVVALGVLSAAYLTAHPEMAAQLSDPQTGKSGTSNDDDDEIAHLHGLWDDLESSHAIHNAVTGCYNPLFCR